MRSPLRPLSPEALRFVRRLTAGMRAVDPRSVALWALVVLTAFTLLVGLLTGSAVAFVVCAVLALVTEGALARWSAP